MMRDFSNSISKFVILLACLPSLSDCLPNLQQLPKEWCDGRDPQLFHQNPSACSSYVSCSPGRAPQVHLCPAGLFFDPKDNACNYKDKVQCVEEEENDLSENSGVGGSFTGPQGCPMIQPSMSLDQKFSMLQSDSAAMVGGIRAFVRNRERNQTLVARRLRGHRRPFRFVQSFLGNTRRGHLLGRPAVRQLEFLKSIRQRLQLSGKDLKRFIVRLQESRDLARSSNIQGAGARTRIASNRGGASVAESQLQAEADLLSLTEDDTTCPFPESPLLDCDANSKFRTIDGSCNNLKHPLWGRSLKALKRLIPPAYEDGITEPRTLGISGRPLKSAREVSLAIMPDIPRPSFSHKLLHMSFGQFTDHDLGRTAITKFLNEDTGELVDVECGSDGCSTNGIENEACLPISVPDGDPDFNGFRECLMFVRSQEVLKEDCSFGPRQQLNQVTSYFDASQVYGSVREDADALRNFSDPWRGRMNVSPNPDPQYKNLLPQSDDVSDCRDFTPARRCFFSGDTRVNEQNGLTAVHTIFHRYHNFLEERLHSLNPHWDGERLYQETRRIVGAIWQFIVYNEYLPITLGPALMTKYNLNLLSQGYFNGYDEHVNAEVANSVQTAAFRFGHSEVSNTFPLGDQAFNIGRTLRLSQVFNRPTELYNNNNPGGSGVDSILLGQMSLDAQNVDNFFAKEVTANLFSEIPTEEPGTDLVSLNIQRGRDHGLPGYVEFRQWCGLGHTDSFDDLKKVIHEKLLARLKETYEHVEDIDLYAGGLSEPPVKGGLLGPTFGCILARQFRNARVGDRFWHERQHPITGFTKAQLSSIRKMTLARIMCSTMDNVQTIQKYVMLNPFMDALEKFTEVTYPDPYTLISLYRGEMNERQPCYHIPNIDIALWMERNTDRYEW